MNAQKKPIHRYVDGNAYRPAQGRSTGRAGETAFQDTHNWRSAVAVIDLPREKPIATVFMKKIIRELRIRCYSSASIKSYKSALTSLLRWSARAPHEITREHVREYLEYLVDSGRSSSDISLQLAAIRTTFDKMCFQDITLGLMTPRKNKTLPVVLSKDEILRLLEAAVTLRDKMLLGLMYATGVRVAEVVRLRWSNIDFDRNVIRVTQGKGRVDREVMLPHRFRQLFLRLAGDTRTGFLFPSEARTPSNRYLSPRTVQRIMKRALAVAGIRKLASPHSLRHAFATHSFENGCDIRRIQKVLGHVNLETTTIYVKVAQPTDPTRMPSPIDDPGKEMTSGEVTRRAAGHDSATRSNKRPVGRLRVHTRRFANEQTTQVTVELRLREASVYLTGIRACQSRPGFWTLQIPPLEDWSNPLARLSLVQRQRISEKQFYLDLRDAIIRTLSSDVPIHC